MANAFAAGVVVFFRQLDNTNTLARSVHPSARDVEIRGHHSHMEDYVILGPDDEVLGIYPRDWVACILPLQTTGPAGVIDQQTRRSDPSTPASGDSQGFPR